MPLWRLDAGLLINSHETTHLRFADVSAALLHYKLMNVALRGRHATGEAGGTAYLEADADVEAIRRHSRYAARLARAVARRSVQARRLARNGGQPDAGRRGPDGRFRRLSATAVGLAARPQARGARQTPRSATRPGVGCAARRPGIVGAVLEDVGAVAGVQRRLVAREPRAVRRASRRCRARPIRGGSAWRTASRPRESRPRPRAGRSRRRCRRPGRSPRRSRRPPRNTRATPACRRP